MRQLIAARTKAGIAVLQERGHKWGKAPSMNPQQVKEAKALIRDGKTVRFVARKFKVSETTVRNYGIRRRKSAKR
jgi:DNA invertase Pin-like site-specific DNA recombinase